MTKRLKLQERLLRKPKDFTWNELVTLMKGFDYEINNKGKTSGSAVIFESENSESTLYLHKPHPQEILKRWQVEKVIDFLVNEVGVVDFPKKE
jgi:hypothetical protein